MQCNGNFKQWFHIFLIISEAWQGYESKAYGVSNHNLKLQSKKLSRTRDIPNFPTQGWADTAFCMRNWSETCVIDRKYWYIYQIKPKNGKQERKNVPLTTEKCPICQFTNCCKNSENGLRAVLPMHLHEQVCESKGSAAMLAIKRSEGDTPEVNLRNPLYTGEEACKWETHPGFETQGRWTNGQNVLMPSKFFLKILKLSKEER